MPRDVVVRFEALLFRATLEPLVKPLGFFGDAALEGVAVSIARSSAGFLRAELERAVAR